jgi:apoptosis-inducing factor 2
VHLVLGARAVIGKDANGAQSVTLSTGEVLTADVVLDVTKKGSATTDFLPAQCLNEEKEIQITPNLTFSSAIPHANAHFGLGDVVAWSGIKRAGNATIMGELVAANIFASVLKAEDSSATYALAELPRWPAVIGLAVGKQCLIYDPENGMKFGVQVMKDYFQDDLAWTKSLQYLGLTDVDETDIPVAHHVQIKEVGVAPEVSATA